MRTIEAIEAASCAYSLCSDVNDGLICEALLPKYIPVPGTKAIRTDDQSFRPHTETPKRYESYLYPCFQVRRSHSLPGRYSTVLHWQVLLLSTPSTTKDRSSTPRCKLRRTTLNVVNLFVSGLWFVAGAWHHTRSLCGVPFLFYHSIL